MDTYGILLQTYNALVLQYLLSECDSCYSKTLFNLSSPRITAMKLIGRIKSVTHHLFK